jgi:DNA-binding NarL/FixJ family response regulator
MKALIVDDHPLIQDALSGVLLRLDPQAEVSVAGDCERGLEVAGDGAAFDVVLLDLDLPGLSGLAALRQWRRQLPDVPVVIVSASVDAKTVLAAMAAGAAGYIPKASASEVMVGALRLVLAGGRYLPPQVLAASAPASSRAKAPATAAVDRGSPGPAGSVEALGLTGRQVEVLRLIARGASNKAICRELQIAERTVKAHVTAVLRALGVSSRTQAAIHAATLDLTEAG